MVALATILTLVLFHHGHGAEWRDCPPGKPVQMRFEVNYDPKLSDPFFETEEWTIGEWGEEHVNGRIVYTRRQCLSGEKESDCLKNTARCFSSFDQDHTIDFCHARLLDRDTIELLFYDEDSLIEEYLRIVIQGRVFWSQYCFPGGAVHRIWTTKQQDLTLDKQVYRKGGVIKGRIDFESLGEDTVPPLAARARRYGRNAYTVTVKGVFKTILE